MKDLYERAKQYAPGAFDMDEIIPTRMGHIVNVERIAYMEGAEDQYQRDVDKACRWLEDLFYRDFGLGVNAEKVVNQFRKAMEE